MNDSTQERQQRLAAMRNRRTSINDVQDPISEEGGAIFPAPRNTRKQRGGGKRRAAGAIIARLRKILTEPAPDSPLIPGTPVREANVAELVRLLRQRAVSPEATGTKLAKRIIQFLTKDDDGEKTVDGVSVKQLKKFLAFAVKQASRF